MKTFLIADDSREKILFLRHMLKCAKWEGNLLIAETTEEAKALINANPDISAAFIDYYIPSENGPVVIAYLREKCPQSRIALVSSADNPENTARAKKAGAEAAICTTHQSDFVEREVLGLLEAWMGS